MNLRVPCLAFALLSIAATGDPCSDGGSVGSATTFDAGPNGAVCEVFVAVTCCAGVDDPCSDNNGCCTGNCSGSSSSGDGGEFGAFDGGGSTCAEPANEGCTIALSSRCNSGMCECTSDADCCLGNCVAATIPGTRGKRCCLESGNPCDAAADCCSLTCNDSGQCD